MNKFSILALLFVAVLSFTCNNHNPGAPGKATRVTFDLTFTDSGSPGFSMPVHGGHLARPAVLQNAQLHQVVSSLKSIDRVKVVFYTIDVDYETINQNYEKNMDAIWEYINHLQGDKSDFEGYWMKQDRGELDFVASAQYRVEKTADLEIKNNTAHGEFELTGGLKACRLGLWQNGKLMYVGRASMLDESGYFNVTAGETNRIQVYLIPISYFSNTAPTAGFTVSPGSGTVWTVYTFDASGSHDVQDSASSLLERWDWEDDGVWDTDFSYTKTATHHFPTAGIKTVKLEVMDSGGLTDETTLQITVSEPRNIMEIEWIPVSGGTFDMGDVWGDGDDDEVPVHSVTLNNFELSKFEITNSQYAKFLFEYGSEDIKTGEYAGQKMIYQIDYWGEEKLDGVWIPTADHYAVPSIGVTWYGAFEFCRYYGYRLPTEAEWEYAARSGGMEEKWAGTNNENEVGLYAWYLDNHGTIIPIVGVKKPNSLGLYDMSGGVYEWCLDWYGYYSGDVQNNPTGPTDGALRVMRSGAWQWPAKESRCANRLPYGPANYGSDIGFRPAR
jgi:formylglycine-generating enzyme required for sulfatase activity